MRVLWKRSTQMKREKNPKQFLGLIFLFFLGIVPSFKAATKIE
jgi:hypothetical protein